MFIRPLSLWVAVLAMVFLATTSTAQPIFDFGFHSLDGDFDGVSSFTANATAVSLGGPYNSDGYVNRVVAPMGSVNFAPGFVTGAGMEDYNMSMTIGAITATTATGAGSLTITDVDGDTITADVSGTWSTPGGPFASFSGLLSNVMLNENTDGVFEDAGAGSISMDFDARQLEPYNGAIITLFTGSWFSSAFSNQDTLVNATVIAIPAPAALVLGGLGLGLVGLVRRRFNK